MTRQNRPGDEGQDELADALAQIESLQAAAADAEARAETARQQLADALAAGESAATETEALRSELAGAQGQVREAALRYRAAQLTAHPEVPGSLVPEGDSIDEVDRALETAINVVAEVKERAAEEGKEGRRGVRIPAGSPARRGPDVGSLPPSEKIRLGLQQLSERPNR